jgi:hypothetical protein
MIGITFLAVSSLFMTNEAAYLDRVEALRHRDGLFLDRSSDQTTVSSAATGFGVLAMAEGASRGLRNPEEVSKAVRHAYNKTTTANPPSNRGWLAHFTGTDGTPKPYSEVSSIDTAIFFAGMLRAAELLKDEPLRREVEAGLAKVDREFLLRDGVFLHGFYWRNPTSSERKGESGAMEPIPEMIPYVWNDSSEGLILYKLFNMPFPMQIKRLDYPLFVYAYPLVFFDVPEYEEYLESAIRDQIERYGYWGVTSTDGPQGYVSFDKEVISPILVSAIATKFPRYLEPIQPLSIDGSAIAMHVPTRWTSTDSLAIDLASAYVLHAKWSSNGPTSPLAADLANRPSR